MSDELDTYKKGVLEALGWATVFILLVPIVHVILTGLTKRT